MKTRSFPERLDDKSALALLANHFRERYNYNPAMAEAIFRDAVFVRTLFEPAAREDGQIICHFPKATEPAGKPLRDCEYVTVRLTWRAPDDAEFLEARGTKALRRRRLGRICEEALAQGGPVTQEDLAVLLGCHRSTVIRDMAEMKAQGDEVVTRGDVTDQGRGTSHKRPILKMHLFGYPPTEVARRTNHALESVERYVESFFRVACLCSEGKGVGAICRITKLSRSLVEEYLAFYQDLVTDPVFAEPLAKRLYFFQEGLLPLLEKKGAS